MSTVTYFASSTYCKNIGHDEEVVSSFMTPPDLEYQSERHHHDLQENRHDKDLANYGSLTQRLLAWGVEYRGATSRYLCFGRTIFWSRNTTSG